MSLSTPMSRDQFWLCTVGLLIVWIVVFATATPREEKSPSLLKFWGKNQAQEQRLENSCKSVCDQCGCLGFYCGEQCLCEYNKLTSPYGSGGGRRNNTKTIRTRRSDLECIGSMHREANMKNLPYEVLIQGPSNDRFIRAAKQFVQDLLRTVANVKMETPQKRSTISIYKPSMSTKTNMLSPSKEIRRPFKDAIARLRRSTDHLDWFSDLANTLVRPAPRRKTDVSNSGNKKREAHRSEEDTTHEQTDSWFSDHPKNLLRPAPLFRRKVSQQKPSKKDEENDNVSHESNETPMAPVRKAIKNTIRNLQESELGEGLRKSLRSGKRDSDDMFQKKFDGNNLEILPKRFRDDFVEVFESWMKTQQTTEKPAVPARSQSSNTMLPWLRPVRFLQKVQQALN